MIAYAYAGGYALVSADPIGAPGSIERIIDEFLAYCRDRAWRVSFLAVREEWLDLYKEHGFRGIYLGDEAIIRCDSFSLKGGAMKAVREAVHRVGREHRFRLIRESDAPPALVASLNEISKSWRGGSEERGFTMELTREVEGLEPDFLLALCLDGEGAPAGFLRLVPCYGDDPGFSLDLMRRRPDAPNGATEFLIANAALALGERGFRRLSMNFAAWGRLFEEDRNLRPPERIQKSVASSAQSIPADRVAARLQPEVPARVAAALDRRSRTRRRPRRSGFCSPRSRASSTCRSSVACWCRRQSASRTGAEVEPVALLASVGSLYDRAIVDTGKEPEFFFFVAFLASFGFIRSSAHMIRAQVSWWPGNVEVGGTHIHHLVWGILLLLISGYIAVSFEPGPPGAQLVAIAFGIGTGLTLDEFALWLTLRDVYWEQEGRRSIDAVIIVAALAGLLLIGFRSWVELATGVEDVVFHVVGWSTLLTLICVVVNLLKEKFGMAIAGFFIAPIAWIGAVRLGRPDSPWGKRYPEAKRERARARFAAGARHVLPGRLGAWARADAAAQAEAGSEPEGADS